MENTGFLSKEEAQAIGFATLGENVLIDRTARFYGAARISIGSNVRIDAYSVLSAGAEGIFIGSHVHISVYVFLTGAARIELHDFSGLSARVTIYSSNDDYLGHALTGPTVPEEFRKVTNAPVSVGKHVVIGAGSVVLPGVTILEGACVGGLSLIKKDIAAYQIVAGREGKVVRERRKDFLAYETRLSDDANERDQAG